jgi:hypothetical protein
MIGVCAITLAGVVAVNSQQPATTQTTSDGELTRQAYVFPSERERFKRYINSTVGPWRLARTAASAGINQWRDHPEEWGQGMKGYSKRYASSLGQNAIQQTVEYGLDEAMGLDTGFERSKRDGFFPRVKDALLQNVTSRDRNGNRVVSVPRFAGIYTSAIVARETWYPEGHNYKDGLRSGTTDLLTGFGINLVREFVINW